MAKYITDFPDNRLVQTKNVVAMPHLGASTPESETNCAIMAADELREYEKIYGKQVHIEIFTRDSQPVFVLFDYARRNPLTNDAHVEVLG